MIIIDFIKILLEFFQSITESFGVAIILTSLLISTILMPFLWLAEQLQKKENEKKKKMKVFLDEFKNIKNKREKFYYTREVYRKFNYNPLKSLIGFSGLIIQLPFFIAIYWLLIDYTDIKSITFGPINDLSKPDGLLTIGDLKINLLPFLMTIANLLSLFIYSFKADERRNLILISTLFLLLLYNLPSSLLLYWTFNNIFSVFKTYLFKIIQNSKFEIYIKNKLKALVKRIYEFKTKNLININIIIASLIPILSFYISNLDQSSTDTNKFYLLIILIATLALFSLHLLKFILKNNFKAHIICFISIAFFFIFGHIVQFIQTILLIEFRYAYIFVFILLGLLYLTFFLFTIKTRKDLSNFSKKINAFTLIFLGIIFIRLCYFNINNYKSFDTNLVYEKLEKFENQNYPDIYYIVLDAYANPKILKDYFSFNNTSFENFLLDNNFYLIKNSKANYTATFLSLSSVLNMQNISFLKGSLKSSLDRSIPYQMIRNNKVLRYLKEKGYKSYHFDSKWGPTIYNEYYDINYSDQGILDEFSSNFLLTTPISPVIRRYLKTTYRNNILNTFEKLSSFEKSIFPKFVFAHLMPPHPPYLFDKNGKEISKSVKINNDWSESDKEFYIGQLEFVNKKITNVVNNILSNSNNSVIIIQSDHGPAFLANWDNPSDDFLKERLLNFNAIKIPQKYKSKFIEPESIVNTFPSIFNVIFNDSIDNIKDQFYFSNYLEPYNFEEIPLELLELK
tara:strand:+ start:5699 stop:7909 length:2211 start_codon:yes stop_codon:yes gene_type:complete